MSVVTATANLSENSTERRRNGPIEKDTITGVSDVEKAQIEKEKRQYEEAVKLRRDFSDENTNKCVLFEYRAIEKSLSKALASHPEALAIALATLQQLSEPRAERLKDWVQRLKRFKEARQNGRQNSSDLST